MSKISSKLGKSRVSTLLWIFLALSAVFIPVVGLTAPEESQPHILAQRATQAVKIITKKIPFKVTSLGLDILEERQFMRLDGEFAPSKDSSTNNHLLIKNLTKAFNKHFLTVHQVKLHSGESNAFSIWLSAQNIPNTTVVLLAKEDGSVGAISVAAENEPDKEQVLDKPGQGLILKIDSKKAPEVFVLSEKEINNRFSSLLQAEPALPKTFMIFFNLGYTIVNEKEKIKMQQIFTEIANRTQPKVEVIGHTDRVGSSAANIITSRYRAERVAEYIKKNSALNTTQISVVYMGEKKPLIPTEDSVEEPRNRRVEITVY